MQYFMQRSNSNLIFKFRNGLQRNSCLQFTSPNQVLTHAARAAAKQLNKAPLVAARGARRALVRATLQQLTKDLRTCYLVKPARLHFARTARALTGRYMTHVCERGDLSEFLVARTCASCWLIDNVLPCAYCPSRVHCLTLPDPPFDANRF